MKPVILEMTQKQARATRQTRATETKSQKVGCTTRETTRDLSGGKKATHTKQQMHAPIIGIDRHSAHAHKQALTLNRNNPFGG